MTAGSIIRRFGAATVLAALLWGCGENKSNQSATSLETGDLSHTEGWLSAHGQRVLEGSVIACTSCHGEALDGGSSGVACAECHAADGASLAGNPALAALEFSETNSKPTIDHPTGFDQLTVVDDTIPFFPFPAHTHGYIAKADSGGDQIPVGFEFCSDCHSPAFTGAVLPTPPFPGPSANCLACHGNETPHSPDLEAWGPGYHHITTSPDNTVICVECHAGARNSPFSDNPPTPDLTVSNNCFNGTLCHTGNIVTTPIVDHGDPSLHPNFHKRNPRACMICHGDDLKGRPGGAAPSCFSCHNGNIAPLCTTCHDASIVTGLRSLRPAKTALTGRRTAKR